MNSSYGYRLIVNITQVSNEKEAAIVPPSPDSFDFILRKYAYPIIIILGFLGNTVSAFVFLNPQLRRYSCNIFLATRSLSDNGVLFSLLVAWLDFIFVRIFHVPVICQLTVFLSYICSFLSVWCIVCVTIDNYIRMCYPSIVNLYCKSKYAFVILSVLITISLGIYNIPLWTTHVTVIAGNYYCWPKQEYIDILYILTYVDTALTFVFPLSAILICMSLLICKAVRSHQRSTTCRERYSLRTWPSSTSHYLKVTKLLFAVSVTFLILHTPTHVIKLKSVIEAFAGNPQQLSGVVKTLNYVFQVMYCLNFAVNFIVYYTFGNNFRQIVAKSFCSISNCKIFNKRSRDSIPSADTMSADILEQDSML